MSFLSNIDPLYFALSNNNTAELNDLLSEKSLGIDLDAVDSSGYTYLHLSLLFDNATLFKKLLTKKCDVATRAKNGKAALHLAAMLASAAEVKQLYKHGATLDILDNKGRTPLHLAALVGKPAVLNILLMLGANSSLKDKNDDTPLSLAIKFDRKDSAKILRAYAAQ